MTATMSFRIWEPLRGLEDRGLRVGAEDLLQGGDDLALRGMYAGAVEKVRHQVGLRRGRLAQLAQCGLDRGAVAAAAHGLDAVDLLALERGVGPVELELALTA